MYKMDRDGENKHKYLTGPAPVMPCQNSSWITSLRIYGERRTQIPLSSPATKGPLARFQNTLGYTSRVYTDIKIANNNSMNRIIVSFTDHYHAVSIDRLSSKTKIGKDS